MRLMKLFVVFSEFASFLNLIKDTQLRLWLIGNIFNSSFLEKKMFKLALGQQKSSDFTKPFINN